jgi:hypothetical protein
LNHVLENRKRNLASLRTEKAVSEALIAPMLLAVQEANADKITVFSGEPLAAMDLTGVCDFLITADPHAYEPKGCYVVLVEAKRNDLFSGLPQCVAEMLAAQTLNREQRQEGPVYGCVSTGLEWLFLELRDQTARTHPQVFTITEAPQILAVFGWMVEQR